MEVARNSPPAGQQKKPFTRLSAGVDVRGNDVLGRLAPHIDLALGLRVNGWWVTQFNEGVSLESHHEDGLRPKKIRTGANNPRNVEKK